MLHENIVYTFVYVCAYTYACIITCSWEGNSVERVRKYVEITSDEHWREHFLLYDFDKEQPFWFLKEPISWARQIISFSFFFDFG